MSQLSDTSGAFDPDLYASDDTGAAPAPSQEGNPAPAPDAAKENAEPAAAQASDQAAGQPDAPKAQPQAELVEIDFGGKAGKVTIPKAEESRFRLLQAEIEYRRESEGQKAQELGDLRKRLDAVEQARIQEEQRQAQARQAPAFDEAAHVAAINEALEAADWNRALELRSQLDTYRIRSEYQQQLAAQRQEVSNALRQRDEYILSLEGKLAPAIAQTERGQVDQFLSGVLADIGVKDSTPEGRAALEKEARAEIAAISQANGGRPLNSAEINAVTYKHAARLHAQGAFAPKAEPKTIETPPADAARDAKGRFAQAAPVTSAPAAPIASVQAGQRTGGPRQSYNPAKPSTYHLAPSWAN